MLVVAGLREALQVGTIRKVLQGRRSIQFMLQGRGRRMWLL